MVSILKNALVWFAAATLATVSAADQTAIEFDPGQTQVHFTLPALLHTVHGEFKLKKGSIRFDPETGTAAGAIVIDAQSGNSGTEMRDNRMHKSILESDKYPEITFTPQRVQGKVAMHGESNVDVIGLFNLHGADHPLTIPVKVAAQDGVITAGTHFSVPYIQWGLKNPSTLMLRVADKADIEIHATGRIVAGK